MMKNVEVARDEFNIDKLIDSFNFIWSSLTHQTWKFVEKKIRTREGGG